MSRIEFDTQVTALKRLWDTDSRWQGIRRDYTAEDVVRLRGSVQVEETLARHGAERLWSLLTSKDYVHTFGALTGTQAVQMVKAGLDAIYLSGWPPMRISRPRPIPISHCIRRTACRTWSAV
jgi:isocitrate lyase